MGQLIVKPAPVEEFGIKCYGTFRPGMFCSCVFAWKLLCFERTHPDYPLGTIDRRKPFRKCRFANWNRPIACDDISIGIWSIFDETILIAIAHTGCAASVDFNIMILRNWQKLEQFISGHVQIQCRIQIGAFDVQIGKKTRTLRPPGLEHQPCQRSIIG